MIAAVAMAQNRASSRGSVARPFNKAAYAAGIMEPHAFHQLDTLAVRWVEQAHDQTFLKTFSYLRDLALRQFEFVNNYAPGLDLSDYTKQQWIEVPKRMNGMDADQL
jgi:hypothetical protein